MEREERIIKAIYGAIDSINRTLPSDSRINKTTQSILIGEASGLDSLTIPMLIVAIEDKVKEEFGRPLVLTNLITVPYENNPLRNVSELVNYISPLLGDRNNE